MGLEKHAAQRSRAAAPDSHLLALKKILRCGRRDIIRLTEKSAQNALPLAVAYSMFENSGTEISNLLERL